MRLLSTSGLRRGDFVFVDRELMQIRELPKGPDEDTPLTQFRGRRISFEGTSGESHANTRAGLQGGDPSAGHEAVAERIAAVHAATIAMTMAGRCTARIRISISPRRRMATISCASPTRAGAAGATSRIG